MECGTGKRVALFSWLLVAASWENWLLLGCMLLWGGRFGNAPPGTSAIHGRMLNILVWCGLVRLVTRVSADSHVLIGLVALLVGIVIHWWVSRTVVRRWHSQPRPYCDFDTGVSMVLVNGLVVVVMVNGVWHWQEGGMGDI